MAAIRAIILDCDGVLADTERLHLDAFREALAPRGIEVTEEEYRTRLLGLDDRACAAAVLRRAGAVTDAEVDAFVRRKRALYGRRLDAGVPVVSGVIRFLRRNVRTRALAVVSGACRAEVTRIIDHLGVADLIGVVVAAEDVGRSKPHPEPYLQALDRLCQPGPLDAAACAVVEDSPVGMRAARDAGMRVIGLTTTYGAADLAAADLVIDSFGDLTDERLARLGEAP